MSVSKNMHAMQLSYEKNRLSAVFFHLAPEVGLEPTTP